MELSDERVYISGPMTGLENYNREAFFDAERKLYLLGAADVYNPARLVDEFMLSREGYMLMDLGELTSMERWEPYYGYIAMLKGWEKSPGSRLERDIAHVIGMEVIYL